MYPVVRGQIASDVISVTNLRMCESVLPLGSVGAACVPQPYGREFDAPKVLRALAMVNLGNGLPPAVCLNALMRTMLNAIGLGEKHVVASAFVSLAGKLGSLLVHLGSSSCGGKSRRKDQEEEVSVTCVKLC